MSTSLKAEVPATLIPWAEPPMDLINHRWHGPKGAFIHYKDISPNKWVLCCPQCGQLGGPKTGATWVIMAGSFDHITTLTLRPSIAMECCGWHGYLTGGLFHIDPRAV